MLILFKVKKKYFLIALSTADGGLLHSFDEVLSNKCVLRNKKLILKREFLSLSHKWKKVCATTSDEASDPLPKSNDKF
ncbi:hypothetical protein BCT94_00835 [Vibrio breoganii]|uniref:Uncharacterized protein n=1 Tax=Vibrio breoganii TaxID=553239 RepID=A0AAP8SV04_9VIBR|nr:hypothetical protein BCT98_09740 [Vibrio breoganii]PMK80066.1 hypothetical protein BCT94_00835 [Vibrio breoganii]PMP05557.1 hypothetical protein BCS93_18655 [Vibrio breoganii]